MQLGGKILLLIHESVQFVYVVVPFKSVHFIPGTTMPSTLTNSRTEAQKLLHSSGLFCDVMRERDYIENLACYRFDLTLSRKICKPPKVTWQLFKGLRDSLALRICRALKKKKNQHYCLSFKKLRITRFQTSVPKQMHPFQLTFLTVCWHFPFTEQFPWLNSIHCLSTFLQGAVLPNNKKTY